METKKVTFQDSFEAIQELTPSSQVTTILEPDDAMKLKIDRYWLEFHQFYNAFVKDIEFYYKKKSHAEDQDEPVEDIDADVLYLRDQMEKYNGNLSRVPEIS